VYMPLEFAVMPLHFCSQPSNTFCQAFM
jgi:hypothetical protein